MRVRPADVIPGGWAVDLYDGRGRWQATCGPYTTPGKARAKAQAWRRSLRGAP